MRLSYRAIITLLACASLALCSCGDGDSGAEAASAADTTAVAADSTLSDSAAAAAPADSAATDSAAAPKLDAIPVETAAAVTGSISSYLQFNSTVETEAVVEVYPQVSGLVAEVLVQEGDRVEADQLLVRIADEELQLAEQEARVALDHLETGFGRTDEMFQRKLISNQEYEDKSYQLEQARLRWRRARLELEHTRIRAPFAGVITERLVQVGARVAPGTKLLALIKLDDMIARVYVPGQYLTAIRSGQRALVTSDFLEGQEFSGWVKRVSPVVDPRSGTFKVTVGLRDRFEHLRPGIFVNVRIVTDTHANAVLVPKQAIVYDGGDRFIFVVADSTAHRLKLDAGFEDDTRIEALSGVTPDASVIVVGQNGLKDQARVKVVNQRAAATATPDSAASQG